jgi:hypothetical protein
MPRVHDDQTSPACQLYRARIRRLMPDGHSNAFGLKGPLRFSESFEHEGVMTLIRLGPALGDAEEYEDWLLEMVGFSDRVLKRMVVFGSLGSLHPVEHIVSGMHWLVIEDFYSLGLNHLEERYTPNHMENQII